LHGACTLLLTGSAISFSGVPAVASQAKKPRPPKPEELVGVWIGFWQDGEFARLDLRKEFTGYCAFIAPPDSIIHQQGSSVYSVTRWSLDREKLTIDLTPIDSRLGSIYLTGRAFDTLDLEVGGTNGKWKEKIVLRNETQIQSSNLETKEAIEKAEKK
jgi:hypothetical protein